MALQNAGDWSGKIESISHDGNGIGTVVIKEDGKMFRRPIFVPYTTPGDEVKVSIVKQQRKYSFGKLLKVINPSPLRVVPLCPHYTECGGCNLQHIAYDEQRKQKAQQIQFILARKDVALPKNVEVLPSAQRHNYRWRSRIAVAFDGKVTAGFRRHASHEIIKISSCFIVEKEILALITALNAKRTKIKGVELEVLAVMGEHRKLGVLVPLDDVPPALKEDVKDFFDDVFAKNRTIIANLFFQEGRNTKTAGQVQQHLTYKAAGMTFSFLPEVFIQSNVSTNDTLVQKAIAMLFHDADVKGVNHNKEFVLDLYAGIGNLSLPISKKVRHVIAVEGVEASVMLGKVNAAQNKVENVTFIHRSTEKYMHEYVKAGQQQRFTPEYIPVGRCVIDPPRTGCTPAVIRDLLQSGIKTVLYVSCSPITLAIDLQMLREKYAVKDS